MSTVKEVLQQKKQELVAELVTVDQALRACASTEKVTVESKPPMKRAKKETTPLNQQIVSVFAPGGKLSVPEVLELLTKRGVKAQRQYVNITLLQLVKKGLLQKEERGVYRRPLQRAEATATH